MSDNIGPKELSNAFKYLLAYQLDSIASDGVMPSAHGALHKLLCSCYSKNTEVVDIYDMPGDNVQENQTSPYMKRAIEAPENNNKTRDSFPTSSSSSFAPPAKTSPSSTLPTAPSSELTAIRKADDSLKKRKENDEKMKMKTKKFEEKETSSSTTTPIIVEVYDDTPKMMLSTVNNPYRGGTNNNSNNNNSNHRMVIEDVTDDPEYSSYGNENEKPENEEEGAFVEYEKLDKTEDPAAYKVCQSTTAVNRTYNNIRPSYRMPIGGGSGSCSSLSRMEIRIDSMNLSDVEDGARCRDKECRLGWKQHPWRLV
ncbi:unnamed protein product [Caenorhabditis brenneri]